MKRERLGDVERSRLDVRRVDVHEAGACPVGRALIVVTRGLANRDALGHRTNAVGRAGQQREDPGQRAIHALGRERHGLEVLLLAVHGEARIVLEELDELREGAGETCPLDHLLHLRADPRDLALARLVHFLGREGQGSVHEDAVPVEGLAVRKGL